VAQRGKPQWNSASAGLLESYKVVWHSRPRLCSAGDWIQLEGSRLFEPTLENRREKKRI